MLEGDGSDGATESEANQSDVKAIFDAAIQFLRLVGSDVFDNKGEACSKRGTKCNLPATRPRPGVSKRAGGKPDRKCVTKAERRKLERIKAPVTVLRRPAVEAGPSENEQDECLNRTLKYVGELPKQEEFQRPPVPLVFINTGADNLSSTEDHAHGEFRRREVVEHEYLSSERDINLWKLLLGSPSNCNVFVGNLSHQVTGEILRAAFGGFCQEDKAKLKVHVVMDAAKSQSRGYGFVNFPKRRAAEVAMICMQDFELHGRSLQLGWGQELKEDSNSSSETETRQSSIGCIVSDRIFTQETRLNSTQRGTLKRKGSRWDQTVAEKVSRQGFESCDEQASCESDTNSNKNLIEEEKGVRLEQRTTRSGAGDESIVEGEDSVNAEGNARIEMKLLERDGSPEENIATGDGVFLLRAAHRCDLSRRSEGPKMEEHHQTLLGTGEGSNESGRGTACVDVRNSGSSIFEVTCAEEFPPGPEQCLNENNIGVEKPKRILTGREQSHETRQGDQTRSSTPKRVIHWLTRGQRISLLKSVCSCLREAGVSGHLGLFGVYYEADNSRLYVVCAKHVTEPELHSEFALFGPAQVKLNVDVAGNSKGCAFVQYSNSRHAEAAMKQLHGKVIGGCPLKVMVAEPKTRKGLQRRKARKSSAV